MTDTTRPEVQKLLTARLLEIPACPGWVIMVSDPSAEAFASALAAEAELRSGHPWVTDPSPKCIAAAREHWRRRAPGWASRDDETIAALLAHGAIYHHLRGQPVLSPERAAAVRRLRDEPARAEEVVLAYRGYGQEFPNAYTVAALLLHEGSRLADSALVVDSSIIDGDDTQGLNPLVERAEPGMPVERYVLER